MSYRAERAIQAAAHADRTDPRPDPLWCRCAECARAAKGEPLTLADIPAERGAASLFIAPDSTGTPRVYYKDADGDITAWSYSADSRHGPARAMWKHLAATLPTVTD